MEAVEAVDALKTEMARAFREEADVLRYYAGKENQRLADSYTRIADALATPKSAT